MPIPLVHRSVIISLSVNEPIRVKRKHFKSITLPHWTEMKHGPTIRWSIVLAMCLRSLTRASIARKYIIDLFPARKPRHRPPLPSFDRSVHRCKVAVLLHLPKATYVCRRLLTFVPHINPLGTFFILLTQSLLFDCIRWMTVRDRHLQSSFQARQ